MDFYEQTDAFRFRLDDLCENFLEEFDINVFTMVGCLEEKRREILDVLDIIEDKKSDLLGTDIIFDLDED